MTMLEARRVESPGWPGRRSEKPEPLLLPPGNSFLRLITARVISEITRTSVALVAERMWPNDQIVARAVSALAMTNVAGWAAELAQKVVTDKLDSLGLPSAAAKLLKLGLVLSFDHHAIISAPGFTAAAGNAGFVAEGQPIPVRQLTAVGAQLTPTKLAAIAVLTREMIESSNAEAMISDVLVRSEGLALDAAFFDSNPASAVRPAGIRNGITALTASSSTDPTAGFLGDLRSLVDAIAPIGGEFALITSPGRAASMGVRFLLGAAPALLSVFGTNAVGNDLIAVAPAALVSAFSPDPEIETSNASTLQMSDAPGQIVNGGAMVGPTKSLLQTDSIAVKVRWPMSWALRSPLACAWLTPTWT